MECIKCKAVDNNPSLSCDGCQRFVHRGCSDLNASELKVMDLRGKRLLKYYCEECLNGVRMVPALLKRIDDVEKLIEHMKNQSPHSSVSSSPTQVSPIEDVINEIEERQRRKNNIIIFNMKETTSVTESGDAIQVDSIIKEATNESLIVKKVFRIGKANKNGHRAVKVILTNHEDALKIIRGRRNVKCVQGITIETDMTACQIGYLKQLREKLNARKEAGETGLYIKYVDGTPRIAKNL